MKVYLLNGKIHIGSHISGTMTYIAWGSGNTAVTTGNTALDYNWPAPTGIFAVTSLFLTTGVSINATLPAASGSNLAIRELGGMASGTSNIYFTRNVFDSATNMDGTFDLTATIEVNII